MLIRSRCCPEVLLLPGPSYPTGRTMHSVCESVNSDSPDEVLVLGGLAQFRAGVVLARIAYPAWYDSENGNPP